MQNKLVFTQVTNYLFENPLDDAAGCNDKHMGSAVLLPQQLSGESQRGYGEKFKAVGAGGCQQHPAVPRALPTASVRLNQRCPEAPALVLSSALRRAAARPSNTRVTSSSSCYLEMLPTCYCCYKQQSFQELFCCVRACSGLLVVTLGCSQPLEAPSWVQGLVPAGAGWAPMVSLVPACHRDGRCLPRTDECKVCAQRGPVPLCDARVCSRAPFQPHRHWPLGAPVTAQLL